MRKRKVGKKAIFFTIVSLIFLSSLIFFYLGVNKYSIKEKSLAIETRILAMDSFINDIEHDIERGLYISSIRSLIGMSEYTVENGSFIVDFNKAFNEVMLNGTIYNNVINITEESNFGTWIDKIIVVADKLDLTVSLSNLEVTPYQKDPWNVMVDVDGIMNITDKKGIASWSYNINISTVLNIIEFEDPLYTIISSGRYTNSIIKSNFTDFVDGGDATNLILQANNSFYIASSSAPSFLSRFMGNFSPSQHGIESIINIDDLQTASPELFVSGASSIDYIHFGNSTVINCQVNETASVIPWLRLDDTHLPIYEATCN